MTLAIGDFLTIADSVAAQNQVIATALGAAASVATAMEGAENVITLIDGLADVQDKAELLRPSIDQKNKIIDYPNGYAFHKPLLRVLNINVGGINAFLTAEGERVAPEFKWAIELLGIEGLDAQNTFPPEYLQLYELEIIGENSATLTTIDSIDTDKYYAAHLKTKKTTAAGGASAIAITFTCTLWNGTTEDKIVNVDASDPLNTEDDIGIASDMYISVALKSITCAVGTVGQKWNIKTELERVVVL